MATCAPRLRGAAPHSCPTTAAATDVRPRWPPGGVPAATWRLGARLVEVFDTGGARGLGVRARRAIPDGTALGIYGGEVLTTAELDARYGADGVGEYAITLQDGLHVDAADVRVRSWAGYVNDARGTGAAVNCVLDGWGVVHSLAHIAAGQELLLDYGDAYWRGTPVAGMALLLPPTPPPTNPRRDDSEN